MKLFITKNTKPRNLTDVNKFRKKVIALKSLVTAVIIKQETVKMVFNLRRLKNIKRKEEINKNKSKKKTVN